MPPGLSAVSRRERTTAPRRRCRIGRGNTGGRHCQHVAQGVLPSDPPPGPFRSLDRRGRFQDFSAVGHKPPGAPGPLLISGRGCLQRQPVWPARLGSSRGAAARACRRPGSSPLWLRLGPFRTGRFGDFAAVDASWTGPIAAAHTSPGRRCPRPRCPVRPQRCCRAPLCRPGPASAGLPVFRAVLAAFGRPVKRSARQVRQPGDGRQRVPHLRGGSLYCVRVVCCWCFWAEISWAFFCICSLLCCCWHGRGRRCGVLASVSAFPCK